MMDWRELEKLRRLAHPELRGVQWKCNHASDMTANPTDTRGRTKAQPRASAVNHVYQILPGIRYFAQHHSNGIVAWVRDSSQKGGAA